MTTVYGARSSQSQMIKKKIFRALQMLIVIVSLQKKQTFARFSLACVRGGFA